MSKYKWIRFISITAALLYAATGSFVYAEDDNDSIVEEAGITIELQDIGTDWTGVRYSCWKIGEVDVNSDPVYTFVEEIDSDIDLNALPTKPLSDNRNAAKELSSLVEDSGITPLYATSDKEGMVYFNNLETGVYLIIQEDGAKYGTMDPYILSIPYTEDGITYMYDVVTAPKAEPYVEPEEVETGVRTNYVPYFLLAGLSFLGIGYILYQRNKMRA